MTLVFFVVMTFSVQRPKLENRDSKKLEVTEVLDLEKLSINL
jgi:hypothetical protein